MYRFVSLTLDIAMNLAAVAAGRFDLPAVRRFATTGIATTAAYRECETILAGSALDSATGSHLSSLAVFLGANMVDEEHGDGFSACCRDARGVAYREHGRHCWWVVRNDDGRDQTC